MNAVSSSQVKITDFTTKSLPRYLLIVLALAGDSTMTSDLPITLHSKGRHRKVSAVMSWPGTARRKMRLPYLSASLRASMLRHGL